MTSSGHPGHSTESGIIVHLFGQTDVGRTREHNEDSFVIADLSGAETALDSGTCTIIPGERGTLFMVADGLGGAAAGEVASEMAVSTVLREVQASWVKHRSSDPEIFAASLKAAAETANRNIHEYAAEHPESRGMGTTTTLAGLLGDTVFLVQVGDSRAYLLRDGIVRQITKDQSLMQRLIDAGEMTPEEAERSERRNIILQALGPEPVVKVDLTFQKLRRGDTLLLCTDGLSGLVSKEELRQIVTSTADLAEMCRRLIDRANENGGPDNITVIAARFEGDGLSPSGRDDPVGHAIYPLAGTGPADSPRASSPFRLDTAAPRRTLPPEGVIIPAPRESAGLVPPPQRANRALLVAIIAVVILAGVMLAMRTVGSGDPAPAGGASQPRAPSSDSAAAPPSASTSPDTPAPPSR